MSEPKFPAFEIVGRVLVDHLARGALSPSVAEMLASPKLDWETLVRAADRNRVLPAFAAVLDQVIIETALHEPLAAFLRHVHTLNAERNRRISQQLVEAVTAMSAAGIRPLLLKGANRLVDDLYPCPAWRILSDIDLLVPSAQSGSAIEALQCVGYTILYEADPYSGKESPASAVLRHPNNLVTIDLHVALSFQRFNGILSSEEMLEEARTLNVGDATALAPATEHQFVHLVMHRMLHHGARFSTNIKQRDVIEAWLLEQRLTALEAKKWRQRFSAHGYASMPYIWLEATDRLLGRIEGKAPSRSLSTSFFGLRIQIAQRSDFIRRVSSGLGYILSNAIIIIGSGHARRQLLVHDILTFNFYKHLFYQLIRRWRSI